MPAATPRPIRGRPGAAPLPDGPSCESASRQRAEGVSFAEVVDLPEPAWVHAEGAGRRVHLHLVGEIGLERAEAPHGAGEGVVGVNALCVHMDVGDPVRAGRGDRRVVDDPDGQVGVGAAVGQEVGLQGRDPSVPRYACFVPHDVGVPLSVGEDGFLPFVFQAHGPPRLPGQQPQEDLDGHVLFAPEAAAQIGAPDADLAVRNPEGPGDVPVVFEHLGAHVDVDDLVVVHPGDAGLRLQVRVVDPLGRVAIFDDDVGLGETGLDVAPANGPMADEVSALVDAGGVGTEGLEGIEHAGQRLVVDRDARERLIGGGLRLRGHQGHGLA